MKHQMATFPRVRYVNEHPVSPLVVNCLRRSVADSFFDPINDAFNQSRMLKQVTRGARAYALSCVTPGGQHL